MKDSIELNTSGFPFFLHFQNIAMIGQQVTYSLFGHLWRKYLATIVDKNTGQTANFARK